MVSSDTDSPGAPTGGMAVKYEVDHSHLRILIVTWQRPMRTFGCTWGRHVMQCFFAVSSSLFSFPGRDPDKYVLVEFLIVLRG